MVKYTLKRLGYAIVTLFVLVTLTFFMQRLLPGDPFVGEKALPEATMAALRAKYGPGPAGVDAVSDVSRQCPARRFGSFPAK